MKKIVIFIVHLAYWALYFTFVTTYQELFGPFSSMILLGVIEPSIFYSPIGLSAIIPALIGFYVCYGFLYKKYLVPKRILFLTLNMLLMSLVAGAITFLALKISFPEPRLIISPRVGLYLELIEHYSMLALLQGALGLIMKGFVTSYSDLKLKAELKEKNNEMELALMKAQMNPHFLFNTINNIDVLIQKDAGKASEYLNKLSDILRFMLYETKNEKIPLEKELSYITKYIDLQKIRTTNLNYVKYDVTGDPVNLLIEPMLFVPLIENAFKHSENKKVEDAIQIRFNIGKDKIEFICENVYSEKTLLKPEYSGLGNELIKRRLVLLYPDKHTFEVVDQNGIYKVRLVLSS